MSWAKHNKLVQDEKAEEHHIKKKSPLDGIFRRISGLFQRGGGDWRPNIPYVISSHRQPGFDRTGAVQQVSRPLRNPVFYENGVVGIRARPARPSNPRGLRPIDFNINLCGGWYSSYFNACYTLQENGAWKQDRTASLNTARYFAASGSVIMSNQLVIAGGSNGNYLSSIELASPNARTTTLPRGLPLGLAHSCIVPWDANTFMVIGGYSSSGASRETYFITPSNKTVTNGPKLQNARYSVACHDMIVNGEEFIIVIGGSGHEKTIEVLSKARVGDGWKMGKNF